jgi:tetratricopeptide (TPR) repeat protein
LVKLYHPDRNPDKVDWAEEKMRSLIRAYETLVDDRQRVIYDRELHMQSRGLSFAERMKRKDHDDRAQSKLVLHYLLQGEADRAVELHEKLRLERIAFSLEDHLDDRDYLDSLFLLGEAYEERRQWRTAARYYWEAYQREKSVRKRFFFEEVKDRLRVLFSQRLIRGAAPEDALQNYRRALSLGIAKRDAAIIYKKIAALEVRLGNRSEAVDALDQAKKLCPGMKTIDEMRRRIAGS